MSDVSYTSFLSISLSYLNFHIFSIPAAYYKYGTYKDAFIMHAGLLFDV